MSKRRIPSRLKQGDLIGLVSPASPPEDDTDIQRGISTILANGHYVRLGWAVGLRDGYLAGPDAIRARDLNEMFLDDRVGAILCTRGGYGSSRLLELLDYDVIARHPKILAGFSDITALSMAMFAHAGLITFAAPMVAADFAAGMPEEAQEAFWMMLTERRDNRILTRGTETTLVNGEADGLLLGGNLTVFSSLIGTPYLPDLRGSILFFEDVGEDVYRIDRMFQQMKQAGILDLASGIVLGSFSDVPGAEGKRNLDTVFREYLLPLEIPVITGLPFGHIPNKITLPLGAHVRLDADSCRLTVLESVVS